MTGYTSKQERLQNAIAMLCYELWEGMDYPKPTYTQWWYGTREQALSDMLDGGYREDNE